MRVSWQSPEIDKDLLKSLQSKQDFLASFHLLTRLLIQLSLCIFLFFSLDSKNYGLTALVFVIFSACTSFMGWAGAGHEYFHSTAFSSVRLNRLLFRLFSCLTWNNWGWFETSHWLHHKFTLHQGDPEGFALTGISRRRILYLATVDLPNFFRRLKILVLNVFDKYPIRDQRVKELLFSKPSATNRIRIGAASVLVFQILLFGALSIISFPLAILVMLSPFTCTLPNRIVEICQHVGMEIHANDFRRNTRTIRFNKFVEFLYSNMNYHTEHHMYPAIPYYNLEKLHGTLLRDNLIASPGKGFSSATKLAFANGGMFGRVSDPPCLSCRAVCPTKPVDIN